MRRARYPWMPDFEGKCPKCGSTNVYVSGFVENEVRRGCEDCRHKWAEPRQSSEESEDKERKEHFLSGRHVVWFEEAGVPEKTKNSIISELIGESGVIKECMSFIEYISSGVKRPEVVEGQVDTELLLRFSHFELKLGFLPMDIWAPLPTGETFFHAEIRDKQGRVVAFVEGGSIISPSSPRFHADDAESETK